MENSYIKNFYEGLLQKYGVTREGLSAYRYCGGDGQLHHRNYFELFFFKKDAPIPPQESECVCGHYIEENCYMVDAQNNFIVLGNCCIKRYMPNHYRSCDICGARHKNRKVNRCNDCRRGKCDGCGRDCSTSRRICYACRRGAT